MAGLEDLLTVGGAVIGGVTGGPQGAITGASLGRSVGGMLSPQEQLQRQTQKPQVGPIDALSRRKMQLDNTPLREIAQSIDSLKYIKDDETRAQLAKPLLQAQYMAKNEGQV